LYLQFVTLALVLNISKSNQKQKVTLASIAPHEAVGFFEKNLKGFMGDSVMGLYGAFL